MSAEPPPPGFETGPWNSPAFVQWSFRHVNAFLPVNVVPQAKDPRTLIYRDCSFAPQIQCDTGSLDWNGYLAATTASAAIVIHDGAIVHETYRKPMRPDDRHMLFSITKSVLGLVALILIERGAINPRKSAADYDPRLSECAFAQAKISDLLTMRDGIPFVEDYSAPNSEIHRYSRHYWGGAAGGTMAGLNAIEHRPGKQGEFAYRTPVCDVLAWVIRGATGSTISQLVRDLIWQPMGAADSAYFVLDTGGHEIGGTGFCATPRDIARLALLLLDNGRWGRRTILPPTVVDQLFAGGCTDAFSKAGYSGRKGWSYSGLWWHTGGDQIAALGVYGQRLFIDRANQFALVQTGMAPKPDNRPFDSLVTHAVNAAVSTLRSAIKANVSCSEPREIG